MKTTDITPMERTPEEKRTSRKAFVLAGVAALGVAAALGSGFMLGGRGDDGVRAGGVSGEQVTPAQQVQVRPTASVAAQAPVAGGADDAATSPDDGAAVPSGTAGDATAGDPSIIDPTPDAGSAPSDSPSPPAPASPPVEPPADTSPLPLCPACAAIDPGLLVPVPAAPPLPLCPACDVVDPEPIVPAPAVPPLAPVPPCLVCGVIDPGIIVPLPPVAISPAPLLPAPPPCPLCGVIIPGIIVHADATPPVISGVDFHPCLGRVSVSFNVNEHADLWVTYTNGGAAATTAHHAGTHGDFALIGEPFRPIRDIVLHAVDDAGNGSTMTLTSTSTVCF